MKRRHCGSLTSCSKDDGGDTHSSSSNNNHNKPRTESAALRSILGAAGQSLEEFFDSTWQQTPALYRRAVVCVPKEEDCVVQDDKETVLSACVDMGIEGVASILERSRSRWNHPSEDNNVPSLSQGMPPPLCFQQQEPGSAEHIAQVYGNNPLAAYLDGCSIVTNHVDVDACPHIAALCQDLQQSLPHVYANSYLTPPQSQAVPPHADDRDVLVLQLYGKKKWKVYETVPIPYPYPQEQVGKAGLEVPKAVLEAPVQVEATLEVGDVLYMPRGFVHSAETDPTAPSFHVTLAISTHDWTLAKTISDLVRRCLDDHSHHVPNNHSYRLAAFPFHEPKVEQQLEHAMKLIKEQVTVHAISKSLHQIYNRHNGMALVARSSLLQKVAVEKTNVANHVLGKCVLGPEASIRVMLDTVVRASTPEERLSVRSKPGGLQGLTVREETCTFLMSILQHLKANPDTSCQISEFPSLLSSKDNQATSSSGSLADDLTLLCFARCCVELGAMAIVTS